MGIGIEWMEMVESDVGFSCLPQHLQAGRFPGGRHMALTIRERMVPLTVVNEEVRAIIGPSSIFLFRS